MLDSNGLPNASNQSDFNGILDDLYADNGTDNGFTTFFSIVDACGLNGSIEASLNNQEFYNEATSERSLMKFGLREFDLDDSPLNGVNRYINYDPDNIDVTNVLNSPSNTQINFYTDSYNHPATGQTITLDEPTCLESAGLSNFYLRPFTNSFIGINIFDSEGHIQVAKLVEVAEREDDQDLCQDLDPSTPCTGNGCIYNINGTNFYALGGKNKIVLCSNVPNGFDINGNESVVLNSNCGLVGNNGVPVLTISQL